MLPATTRPELSPIPTFSSGLRAPARSRAPPQRLDRVVGQPVGRAEHGHQPVADELVDAPAVLVDDRHDLANSWLIAVTTPAAPGSLREPREVADVDEHDRHLDLLAR